MNSSRIAELLQPFLSPEILSFRAQPKGSQSEPSGAVEESAVLSPAQLQSISTYIDLLLRWNARINLTSVRDPEEIVTRHFGESLFAARCLFPSTIHVGADALVRPTGKLIDLGSGAGFPGLPIKIWNPSLHITLIESNHKKVAFLREVIRALGLTDVNVFAGRAEDFPPDRQPNTTVTLRAVENFGTILPVAARLVPPSGRLALLIGESQVEAASKLVGGFEWSKPAHIPLSTARVLWVGRNRA